LCNKCCTNPCASTRGIAAHAQGAQRAWVHARQQTSAHTSAHTHAPAPAQACEGASCGADRNLGDGLEMLHAFEQSGLRKVRRFGHGGGQVDHARERLVPALGVVGPRDELLTEEDGDVVPDEQRRVFVRAGEVVEDGERLEADRVGLLAAEKVGEHLHEAATHDLHLRRLVERQVLQQRERGAQALGWAGQRGGGDLDAARLVDDRASRLVDGGVDERDPHVDDQRLEHAQLPTRGGKKQVKDGGGMGWDGMGWDGMGWTVGRDGMRRRETGWATGWG
jgi:hypothetical protein